VNRPLVLTGLLSLAALVLASSGSAQTPIPTIKRGYTVLVTARTTPTRDRTLPYIFTTTGRIVPPGRYCSPGADPSPGTGNCVPILCPPGTRNPSYCLRPGLSVICSGIVNVRFQKGPITISSRDVPLSRACTYASAVTFRTRLITRIGLLTVRVSFQGNVVLRPLTARDQTVRAG
jgi:hypothetical protein